MLAACGADTAPIENSQESSEAIEDPADRSTYEVFKSNVCETMTGAEIIESVHKWNGEIPNGTWQSVIDAPAERFGVLLDFVGNCYRATPTGDSAEQTADIQFWSLALGGAAITIEHALEDGSYGGISYIYPSAEPDAFTHVYITNAGFHTQGTIIVNDDQSFTASETVNGHPTITEVRSISRFDETGLTSMTSEFLDQDEWQPGPAFTHEVTTEPFPRIRMPIPASPSTSDE